jgi:phage-related tail fiber protein
LCRKLNYLIFFVLAVGLVSNASADPNLVAYYRLDGDAKDTGNVSPPANGNLNGNPTWITGRVGGSIHLDGDDYVSCSNNVKFDITDEITLACWIKTTSGNAWQTITTKVGGSHEGIYRLNFDSSGNNVFFTCEGVPPYNAWGGVPVNDGQWHHLAGVYDGSNLYLYVDGVEDVSTNASGSVDLSPDPFLIGGYDG